MKRGEEALGEDHYETLRAMAEMASTLNEMKRHTEALELEEEVLKRRRKVCVCVCVASRITCGVNNRCLASLTLTP